MKKQCSGCHEKKLRSQFTKDASKPDGLHTRCKACKKPRVKVVVDNAREAAVERLIERHQGEFVRLYYSERVLRGEAEPQYKLGAGWRAMAG
jgi:NAD-dependent SIR2 family protein deacetylase